MFRIRHWRVAGVLLGNLLLVGCIAPGANSRPVASQTFEGGLDEIWSLATDTVASFGGSVVRSDRSNRIIQASRAKSTFPGDTDSVVVRLSSINDALTRVEIDSAEGIQSHLNGNTWSSEISNRMALRLRRLRESEHESLGANKPAQPVSDIVTEPLVLRFNYDSATAKGVVVVDISKSGIKGRDWAIKNIGKIASSKEHLLDAGSEMTTGGQYKVLNESLQNGMLTVEFEVLH